MQKCMESMTERMLFLFSFSFFWLFREAMAIMGQAMRDTHHES
jgi:hypothetical protein